MTFTRRSFLGSILRAIVGLIAYKGLGMVQRQDEPMLAPDYDLEADLKQRFLDVLAKERRLEEDIILNGYIGGSKPALEG